MTDLTSNCLTTGRTTHPPIDVCALRREPLLNLLELLAADGYVFVTATPGTHSRVLARRADEKAGSLRDVLGWSLPFEQEMLPPRIFDLLQEAGAIRRLESGLLWAGVRVSSVRDTLFVHSAFPTLDKNAVFLGPDSYRFADLIVSNLDGLPEAPSILDYGAGAGVGGIIAARELAGSELCLADVSPAALALASVNAQFAKVPHRIVQAARPENVEGDFALVVTHPPFMIDDEHRAYRDGGELYGAQLSLQWALAGLEKLTPGGRLIMHTGAAIVDGTDVLLDRLEKEIPVKRFRWKYRELDPDIFSEDLAKPSYRDVERIAAVGLTAVRQTEADEIA